MSGIDIKKYVKKRINTGKSINPDKLISQIKNYDVVSFDIFDTLLKRCVQEPTDVFYYMEKKLGIAGFAKKRIEAEAKAKAKKQDFEISLEDIYDEFGESYIDAELETEAELLVVNMDIMPVFKWCIERKKVVLISDMYLPEEFIVKILRREGIDGYDALYLSSTINKRKSDGKLYEYVQNELGKDIRIVHIGDNIRIDYINPQKYGIKTVHIPRYSSNNKTDMGNETIEENIISSFVEKTSESECDYYRFGYEKFGMFLWGYVKWLHACIKQENITKIYFLSRDGLIVKNAFDILYKDIETHYLEVSRRSLRVPLLWKNLDFEYVIGLLPNSKLVSLKSIFDGIGLDIDQYSAEIKEHGLDIDAYFERRELLSNDRLKNLYKHILADVESNSKKEYKMLEGYIKHIGLDGKFAIVDIGWAGSMQRYLQESLTMMGIKHDIVGYYVGVSEDYIKNMNDDQKLNINGYLFDCYHNHQNENNIRPFLGLVETLFLEREGSVKNYMNVGSEFVSVRMPYEYMKNGKPTYECEYVNKIQTGALEFVRRFGDKAIDLPPKYLFKGIENVGMRPRIRDIKLFGEFRFFDEGEITYLAKSAGIWKYIANVKLLKKDFLSCRWKIGFMKSVFRIKLPYKNMYRFLLKYK